MSLQLAPLRFRVPDIRPLAERFLVAAATRNDLPARRLSSDAVRTLEGYDWPGNVRELKNVVERAAVVADAPLVTMLDLPEQLQASADTQELTGLGAAVSKSNDPTAPTGPSTSGPTAGSAPANGVSTGGGPNVGASGAGPGV